MIDTFKLAQHARRLRPWLMVGFAFLVVAFLYGAWQKLRFNLSFSDVVVAVQNAPSASLAWAVVATLISYLSLTGYDASAMRYVGVKLPYRVLAKTSFIAFALSNTAGMGVLTGGAVRMRLYGAAGVEPGQIARAIGFLTTAFGVGLSIVGAVALLWGADLVTPIAHISPDTLRGLSIGVLILTVAFLVFCLRVPNINLPWGGRLRLPTSALFGEQLALSAIDIVATAAVLWLLLPNDAIAFPAFVGLFSMALVLGVISHVPGGLGVFEAVILVGLQDSVSPEVLAAALVLYRLTYYLLPLSLAVATLVWDEWRRSSVHAPLKKAAASLAPTLLAAFTLIVAVTLLVSGVTPAADQAEAMMALRMPLPVIEASHFLGSVAGFSLLFVARGMLSRLDAAWWAGLTLTVASAVLALPHGISFPEAALLGFLVLALALSRRQFTRKSSLFAQAFTRGWLLAVFVLLASLVGLLFFAYQNVDYAHELWWQFALNGEASRSLRALMALGLLALGLSWRVLLRPPAHSWTATDAHRLSAAAEIVSHQPYAEAGLALLGDKQLLFAESGQAFVMYARRNRSWVALFDPVGPRAEAQELIWSFRELAAESGCTASFYQVRPQNLPMYLDAGLRVFKLGESAHVALPTFSLEGAARAKLRHAVNRAEREGLTLTVIEAAQVPEMLNELKGISDEWLAEHHTAEKQFSLGNFNPVFLGRMPVALVKQHGRIIAFSNLLLTADNIEASVDMMRHRSNAPPGTMDFLFVTLMLHFKAAGFQRFNLGMAPLSGLGDHPTAPNWQRLGRLLFAHGEHFYNFQGLRAYKEKFNPTWEARYLASSGGAVPLMVFVDIAALISGGLKKVISK